jgi:shikimate kinase
LDPVVILTGFMGVGKSATGRALARTLGWDFVDLDEEIERTAEKSVAQIFEEEGEERFRDLESAALKTSLGRRRVVVATGGGVLLRAGNRELLAGRLVVNLDAPVAVCVERVRGSSTRRPLLESADPEGAARDLWTARSALYGAVVRQVDTQGKSPEAVAREIRERFLPGVECP